MIDKIKKSPIFLYGLIVLVVLLINFFVWINFQYFLTWNYFEIFSSAFRNKDIVIVWIDNKTLNQQWSKRYQDINRDDYAKVINNIMNGDPKAVVVDVFFVNESMQDAGDVELKNTLDRYKNIVLSTEIDEDLLQNSDLETSLVMPFFSGDYNYWFVNTNGNIYYNVFSHQDSVHRNIFPFYMYWYTGDITKQDTPFLPLPLSSYLYLNWYDNIKSSNNYISVKNQKIPLQDGNFNINFFGGTDFYNEKNANFISFIDIYKNNFDIDFFKNKIVFIWATASDIHDEFYTPYQSSTPMPWVMIHANMFNTLTSSKYVHYQGFWAYILSNLLAIICFVLIMLNTKKSNLWFLFSSFVLVLYILVSIFGFMYLGRFIEIFPIIISYVLVMWIFYIIKYLQAQKDKNQIKNMFSKYVSANIVDEIVKTWVDQLKLWGIRKEISVYFSDLQWFTDFSEKLNPEQLWEVLNIYFESMSEVILQKKWTIDKFIWDAVMAFWNAPFDVPDHANLICETALIQKRVLDVVREKIKNLGIEAQIFMRVWINTWEAIVWNFGSSKRYDYTILGDTVNIAARLEWINKHYWTSICISQYTYAQIDKQKFVVRELDTIKLKWKLNPIKIYELVWFRDQVSQAQLNLVQNFEQALNLYRNKNFEEAKKLFLSIWDTSSNVFAQRCEYFIQLPPEDCWDCVYTFTVK